ncbi:unnamed protein product [Discosporangium mesarthrocarpum]
MLSWITVRGGLVPEIHERTDTRIFHGTARAVQQYRGEDNTSCSTTGQQVAHAELCCHGFVMVAHVLLEGEHAEAGFHLDWSLARGRGGDASYPAGTVSGDVKELQVSGLLLLGQGAGSDEGAQGEITVHTHPAGEIFSKCLPWISAMRA